VHKTIQFRKVLVAIEKKRTECLQAGKIGEDNDSSELPPNTFKFKNGRKCGREPEGEKFGKQLEKKLQKFSRITTRAKRCRRKSLLR